MRKWRVIFQPTTKRWYFTLHNVFCFSFNHANYHLLFFRLFFNKLIFETSHICSFTNSWVRSGKRQFRFRINPTHENYYLPFFKAVSKYSWYVKGLIYRPYKNILILGWKVSLTASIGNLIIYECWTHIFNSAHKTTILGSFCSWVLWFWVAGLVPELCGIGNVSPFMAKNATSQLENQIERTNSLNHNLQISCEILWLYKFWNWEI